MKNKQINIRLSVEEQALYSQAAIHKNLSLSQFIREATKSYAEEILLEQDQIIVFAKNKAAFLNALDNPPQPNKKLFQAAKKYMQQTK